MKIKYFFLFTLIIFIASFVLLCNNQNNQTGHWEQLTDMPTGRWMHSAVVLNNQIYVIGGATGLKTPVLSTLISDLIFLITVD